MPDTQQSFLDGRDLLSAPAREQAENIERVGSKIERLVMEFCQQHRGGEFHMADLTNFVVRAANVAPDSPGRILRLLKRRGVVKVELVNRRQSLYRVVE